MVTVFIPPLIRPLTQGRETVEAEGGTVRQIVADLERQFPGTKDRLCADDALRPGLAVAVDGTISSRGLMEKVAPTSEVHFLPALGGG